MAEPEDVISTGDWMTGGEADQLGVMKGAYLLWILLPAPVTLQTKSLKADGLAPGVYLYAGNAYGPGGVAARLKRHFKQDKKPHWHVDVLTGSAERLAALPFENGQECDLVSNLLKRPRVDIALDRFGSTDCRSCRSHLLIAP